MRCSAAREEMLATLAARSTEADRLLLEEHLGACADCRREHAGLEVMRRLKAWEPPSLGDAAHERVRRAVLATRQPSEPRPLGSRGRVWWFGAAAAAVLMVGVVLFFGRDNPRERRVTGDIRASGGGRYTSVAGGSIRLDRPWVTLERGTEIVWHPERHAVELVRGAVVVDVAAGSARGFRVTTPRFSAVISGTRFRVDVDGVTTERGVVEVVDPAGAVLAQVRAGGSWRLAPSHPPVIETAAAPAFEHPAPALDPPLPLPSDSPEPHGSRPERSVTPESVLTRARQALAAGRPSEARKLAATVTSPQSLAVEARLLAAESFLVEGRYDSAIAAYRLVVRRFGTTPQAETALYAIAQLETESGSRDEAHAALARYLERYPRGRFAREARQRLDKLRPAP